MKQTAYILLSLAALSGFAACSSDSDLAPSRSDSPVVVKAAVGKGSIFTRTNPNAASEEEQGKFNAGDKISLSDGTKTVSYTLGSDGETWSPATAGQYLTWGSGATTFKAYYPVRVSQRQNDIVNSYEVGRIPQVQSSESEIAGADYMTATATVAKNPSDHTLNLQFERKTARVIVNVVGYNNQFEGKKPYVHQMCISGAAKTNDPQTLMQVYPLKLGTDKFVALVCPTDADASKRFLEFAVQDTDDESFEVSLNYRGVPALEAGKSYTFNVTVGKDGVKVEDVTVADWATGSVIPGGEATEAFDFGPNVTAADLGKVVASDGTLYSSVDEATAAGKTASAMIAYVGSDTGDDTYSHGLAIALTSARSDAAIDRGNGMYEEYIENAAAALSSYDVIAPRFSGGWRLPGVSDLKHIFASFGGAEYSEGLPSSRGEACDYGNFITQLTACGGSDFPPLNPRGAGTKRIYTTDLSQLDSGYQWQYEISGKRWVGCSTKPEVSSASIRPVFAF